MIYSDFQGKRISALGMGNMRLPTKADKSGIDFDGAREIIEYAYEHGINYFDTAYRYHGGESETVVGKVLAKYPRDTWHIASKWPGHMMQYKDGRLEMSGYMQGEVITGPAQIFEEQLIKCGVEYFDFYLLHNVCETSYDFYTNEEFGLVEYLFEQKRLGRIRHLGFSAHGRADTIERFLNWNDGFEFVQIQLNYLDWTLQDAGAKYEVLARRGIPVIVMEPVRGGSLASLDAASAEMLKSARPGESVAAWAFRYLQGLPGIMTTLSGMSTMAQLMENIDTYSKNDPLSGAEAALLGGIVEGMLDRVPCTACRYCTEACPQGLDIPKLISMHNEFRHGQAHLTAQFTLRAMGAEELPGACQECGACSALCPQGIDIPGVMRAFDAQLAKP